jgi:uncharacterized YccA/Bax inhibitor family protein
MTINGSINKTGVLLLLTAATSIVSWNLADSDIGHMLAIGSIIANFVLCLVLVFNRQRAATLAPAYALVEGLALGAISAWADAAYPGVVSNALILTFSCVAIMLALYAWRIVRVTERMRSIIFAATLAIAFTYIIDLVMMAFGGSIHMIHETGIYGIIFSVAVIGVAAMNLLVDFDMIERSVAQKAPKYMEWYAGFAVLVTVVWLYIEILRLLGKLNRR